MTAVAIDLDGALADTRPLWEDWLASAAGVLGVEPAALPADRAAAAAELDRLGAGNWRTLLERFGEERAAIYLRRDPTVGAALRALEAAGRRIGVFSDAPEPLARVALAQLGAGRRIAALETGEHALERLLATLGNDARRRPLARGACECLEVRQGVGVDFAPVEAKDVGDRQLDALLERLDRISEQLERMNRTAEQHDGFALRRRRAPAAERVPERARVRGARASAAARPPPRRQQRRLQSSR